MQQSIFLTIATLFISLISFGQPPVDVWQVQTPSNPMNCTNTTVTVTGWNDATNYTLQTITHSYGNDTIWIEIPYQSPQIVLGALTSWSHTISLGNVPYGNWTIAARGYLGGTWQSEAYGWLPVGACCPSSIPQFEFVEDTVCANSPITVTNSSLGNNLSYLWEYEGGTSTATTPTFSIAEPGTYGVTLTVTGDTCIDSLVKEIEILAQPEVSLGNDTTVCDGDTMVLTLPAGNDYLWSNGSTSFFNSISTVGSLSVTVTNDDGCERSDTIAVTSILPTISVDLGSDKVVCPEGGVTLNAGIGGSTYAWSNGDSSQIITVNQEGSVSVTVTEAGSCDGADEVQIDWYDVDVAEILLAADSCGERLIHLDPNSHDVVSWSDASADTAMLATIPGYYSVIATDNNGCESTDSKWVNIVENPIIDLGADTFLCGEETILLTTGVSGDHIWKDGSTGISFTITKRGTYTVSVTDQNGCTGADTIKVSDCLAINEVNSEVIILFPNPALSYLSVVGASNESYQIVDGAGRNLSSGYFNGESISVENLESGVYFLKFIGETTRIESFIKN